MIRDLPNDSDLGGKIRNTYSKSEFIQIPLCYHKDSKGRKVYNFNEMQLEFDKIIIELINKEAKCDTTGKHYSA